MHPDAPLVGILFLLLLAVGTPICLLLLSLMRSRFGRRTSRFVAAGVGLVTVLAACLAGAVLFYLHYPSQKFSPQAWAQHPDARYTLRDSLVASRRLLGLSRAQVLGLLGEPSATYRSAGNQLLFDLGYPPSLTTTVRPAVLAVQFDTHGRVARVR
ncbi:hypothetical protein EJV47_08905 [Hymenobacter gummosus]|uniref:Outer membrane protein assembly factor BamE n=1 Tax=Hymenobacter gummosus TaxID=1776032 RepID=A0A431U477_9BACT|nr:hypothetical protein [Hymenobacter gummosus]RTQ50737.1 hypothetical protein EJV47_08905 [Hymenobacter gummosus]